MEEDGYERACKLILDCIVVAGREGYLFIELKFGSLFDHSIMKRLNNVVSEIDMEKAIHLST